MAKLTDKKCTYTQICDRQAPSWRLPRRERWGAAGREALRSPRLRGDGWLLRLSRLAEEAMRLCRRLVIAGLPCGSAFLISHTDAA